ncbi:MAG: photosystem II S4 domain protein [Synechococcus sp. TMED155]|jgi:photosystem II S4 domain protein|nr:MAG: photosystem II S4 domain protein [Synechococcus sp. TMED155]
MLPRRALLEGARHPDVLSALISQAEMVLRTYQPSWSGFLSAPEREEAEARLGELEELQLRSSGGFPQAERRCLEISRMLPAGSTPQDESTAPLQLLALNGNFLFDPADPASVREALLAAGHSGSALGDVLVRGDRGALLVTSQPVAAQLLEQTLQVRTVSCAFELADWSQLPAQDPRQKRLTTVEASLRLDAVASAGFGVSRSRMAELIRLGKVRLDWQPVSSPSRELKVGERVQLEGRGELVMESADLTKRERWRLQLTRTL